MLVNKINYECKKMNKYENVLNIYDHRAKNHTKKF